MQNSQSHGRYAAATEAPPVGSCGVVFLFDDVFYEFLMERAADKASERIHVRSCINEKIGLKSGCSLERQQSRDTRDDVVPLFFQTISFAVEESEASSQPVEGCGLANQLLSDCSTVCAQFIAPINSIYGGGDPAPTRSWKIGAGHGGAGR